MKTLGKLTAKFMLCAFSIANGLTANVTVAATPAVVMRNDGTGVAIWQAIETFEEVSRFTIRGATAANGEWGPVSTISNPNYDSYLNNPQPGQCLRLNSSGDAVAAWSASDGTSNFIVAVKMAGLSTWGTPEIISDELNENPIFYDNAVALDDSVDNEITIFWTSLVGSNPVIRVTTSTIAGEEWFGPITLDPPPAP